MVDVRFVGSMAWFHVALLKLDFLQCCSDLKIKFSLINICDLWWFMLSFHCIVHQMQVQSLLFWNWFYNRIWIISVKANAKIVSKIELSTCLQNHDSFWWIDIWTDRQLFFQTYVMTGLTSSLLLVCLIPLSIRHQTLCLVSTHRPEGGQTRWDDVWNLGYLHQT